MGVADRGAGGEGRDERSGEDGGAAGPASRKRGGGG